MAIQTLYDSGEQYQIDSKYDGAVYATSTPDCVCEGIGDQFKLNYSSNSLTAYFEGGSQAIIGGSFFKLTSRHTLEGNNALPSNSVFYLCARIDLNNPNGQRGSFVYITDLANAQKGNLNGSGTQRDLVLYRIKTGSSGVITVENLMTVKGPGGSSISGVNLSLSGSTGSQLLTVSNGNTNIKFKIMESEAAYNALTTKDPNTLYFIPES